MSESAPDISVVLAGRYHLGKQLGAGSFGQVFRARDAKSGDRVAVKLLHPPLCHVQELVQRFEREFDATQLIAHPNVVRGLEFGPVTQGPFAGTWFLAMELLEGRRLSDLLAAGPIATPRAVRIGLDVANALAAIHAAGVVHRDLEPGNVILTRARSKEVAKVLDFGLARLLTSSEDTLTDFGVRLGTPEFMAPEYVKTGALDASSDVYSLGILLYTMVTGAPPFVGRSLSVMQEHARTTPAPPSLRVGGLPDWLETLIMEMLAKDPAERPTAVTVAERLRAQVEALTAEDHDERRARATLTTDIAPAPASVGHLMPPSPSDFDALAFARALLTPQILLLLAGCGVVGFVGSLTVFLWLGG